MQIDTKLLRAKAEEYDDTAIILSLLDRIDLLEDRLARMKNAASLMVQAYEPSYSNDWMCDDGFGRSHRKDFLRDQFVRDRLKKTIEEEE